MLMQVQRRDFDKSAAYLAHVTVHLCKLGSHLRSVCAMHMADVVHAKVVGDQHVPILRGLDERQELLYSSVRQ